MKCLNIIQFICLLCPSIWVAVLILRQMKSNKLYMHLKLFQREAYSCSLTCFQGHPQARNETFLLEKRLMLSGM